MAKEKPVVYIFHGDDVFSMEGAVGTMTAALGDEGTAELNLTRMDGKNARFEEIRSVALTMPFLAERRLVILSNPLARIRHDDSDEQKKFCAFLDEIPSSTGLVLLIEDHTRNKKIDGQWEKVWEVLKKTHWLMKWQEKTKQQALVVDFRLPEGRAMNTWIQKQAQEAGGKFSVEAAQALAGYVENDTRLATLEIEKLLTYVNWERPVEARDVERLTVSERQVNVFDMVDELALGKIQSALQLLQKLLEQEDPMMVFSMIVRQFRYLIQAREILDEGGGAAQIQKELGILRFVAQKLEPQARGFTADELADIYHRLLDLDEGNKTSKVTLDLGMNLFIAEMSR